MMDVVGYWARVAVMRGAMSAELPLFALTLCLVACGDVGSPTDNVARNQLTATTEVKQSQSSLACTSDVECPSGQRCAFRGDKFSKCIVPSETTHCIDPGGRCGCDGRQVEIICELDSSTEYTSAPACFVGRCPMNCNDNIRCPSSLTCQDGLCGKP
jgi:hypothetical protein